MSATEWQDIYRRAWHLYYSPEHIETLLRRAQAGGARAKRLAAMIFLYYGSYRFENVHPLQCGVLRRKVRTTRRPGLPRVSPLLFYPPAVVGALLHLRSRRLLLPVAATAAQASGSSRTRARRRTPTRP